MLGDLVATTLPHPSLPSRVNPPRVHITKQAYPGPTGSSTRSIPPQTHACSPLLLSRVQAFGPGLFPYSSPRPQCPPHHHYLPPGLQTTNIPLNTQTEAPLSRLLFPPTRHRVRGCQHAGVSTHISTGPYSPYQGVSLQQGVSLPFISLLPLFLAISVL